VRPRRPNHRRVLLTRDRPPQGKITTTGGPLSIALDGRTIGDHFPGIGRYAYHLASALAAGFPDHHFHLLYNPREPNSRFDLPALAARFPNLDLLDCPVSPFALSQQWHVPRLLRKASPSPTVYHSLYYSMPLCTGLPAVVTIYDLIPLRFPTYFSWRERLLFRLAVWFALRGCRGIIAVSRSTMDDLILFFRVDDRRVTVVPAAADSSFRPQEDPGRFGDVRRRYGLPDRYVLYVGSNKPHKNLVRLVDAWATVVGRSAGSGAALVIAGPWDRRYPEARERVEALDLGDHVRFVGPVAEVDLPALYQGAMLFVFPSQYEGFGLPALEAMACGTPVICGNRASLPELVGDASLLVDPDDVSALADAISRLLADESRRGALRQRGLARAHLFSWERVAKQTMAVYQAVCMSGC